MIKREKSRSQEAEKPTAFRPQLGDEIEGMLIDFCEAHHEANMSAVVRLYDYLGWLKRNTMKGASENDVALSILAEVLTKMRNDGYTEPPIQPDLPRSV